MAYGLVAAAGVVVLMLVLVFGGQAAPSPNTSQARSPAAIAAPHCLYTASISTLTQVPVQYAPMSLHVTVAVAQGGPYCLFVPIVYHWFGLPLGVQSANSPTVVGTPVIPGTFHVVVAVVTPYGQTVAAMTVPVTVPT